MSNKTSKGNESVRVKTAEPWETVDHFKVNRWMVKIGAKWTVSEGRKKSGATGIGDQWELDGMIVSQKDAAKWYLATHRRPWWRFWSWVTK